MDAAGAVVRTPERLVATESVGDPHYAQAMLEFGRVAPVTPAYDMLVAAQAPLLWVARAGELLRVRSQGEPLPIPRAQWPELAETWMDLAAGFNQGAGITVAVLLEEQVAVAVTLASWTSGIAGRWAQSSAQAALHLAVDLRADVVPSLLRDAARHSPLGELSPREQEILRLAITGLRPKEIATHFGSSVATVQTQIKSLRNKLGASSLTEAVRVAVYSGLLRFVNRPSRGMGEDDR